MLIIAIFAASLSSFLIGGLWYSPMLFLRQWLKAEGKDIETQKNNESHSKLVFVYSYIFSLITACGFYLLTKSLLDLIDFLYYSIIIGVFFVAASFGINYQFSNRKFSLFLIDAGYHIVQFLIFGIIFWLFV